MTKEELKSQIKFSLETLDATNGHHKFEDVSFAIAKVKITPNLKKATGPVSKGGDQGKDFESYISFISNENKILLPDSESKDFDKITHTKLAVACSIQKEPVKIKKGGDLGQCKLKDDVEKIMDHDPKVKTILFFSNQFIPISDQHKSIKWAKNINITLEVYDLNWFAEELSGSGIGYEICSQYLNIPIENLPINKDNYSNYFEIKKAWKNKEINRYNFSKLVNWICRLLYEVLVA